MSIEDITALSTLLVAIGLASERLVTIVKTFLPEHLAKERKSDKEVVDPVEDRMRRIGVLLIAYLAAWITTSFLASGGFDPFGEIVFGSENSTSIPVFLIAFLSMGGSAFWSNIIGYTSAIKDIRKQQKEIQERENYDLKEEKKISALSGGKTIKERLGIQADLTSLINQQPSFKGKLKGRIV